MNTNSNVNELAVEQSNSNQIATNDLENQAQRAQQQQNSFWSVVRGVVLRALMVYFIMSLLNKRYQPNNMSNSGSILKPSSNLFENSTLMSLYVYVSERSDEPRFKDENELVWVQKNIIFGDWEGGLNKDGIFEHEALIKTSKNVQNNGNLYIHVYLVREGYFPYPSERYLKMFTVHKSQQLNRIKKRKFKNTHNLLTGRASESTEKANDNVKEELVSHWHPNLTINVIYDQTPWTEGSVPSPLDEFIQFEPTTGKYYPIIYLNDYWNYLRDYYPINETTKILPLRLTYQPLSMFKWQLYTAQLMKSKYTNFFGSDLMEESETDQDNMKETLLETSPYLLAITIIVSISHSIFEFLAFKNDIQFWRNRRSLEGLSVRSVFFNVFQSTIVLLYVFDNDTNALIRISIGIGLLIELWKIHKVTNFEINYQNKWFNLIPRIKISDKGSYVESLTRDYDLLAFKYLSWAVFPLFIGYAAYSLIYLEHKGWYSFILSIIYGFLLTFGFIAMTPQLFINYKLKSVAHLPWRMLTYKFLNTFIDDIFAFVIKMPTMYRLGCFRDDVIFLIYLYQRWIYRVDLKRINEFGISGEDIAQVANGESGALTNETKETNETNETKKNQ